MAAKKEKTGVSIAPKKKEVVEKVLFYRRDMTVADVAKDMGFTNAEMIKKLMKLGAFATINQMIDRDTIELITIEEGFELKDEVITDLTRFEEIVIEDDEKDLVGRPPIVTILGHVDHGKTTLLDTIRKARVTKGEAGGITQHIGAYQVTHNKQKITFIDTPGHAAFTEMRARGTRVTDLCVLVVAADDGVMPQTLEALDHAKAANVPIIVAVNKMDRDVANPDRVMSELSERGLTPEDWGGETPYVLISALRNEGITQLLDVIQMVSEISELKANPNRYANGSVIEARLDRGRGVVATLIVSGGTLRVGDNVVVGNTFGKIRTMENDLGKRIDKALPSTPVEITGLSDMPHAGDVFLVFKDERTARQTAESRSSKTREVELGAGRVTSLESILGNIAESEKELNVIVKADVQGSIEALRSVIGDIDVEGFHANIIRASVGAITENDVTLAKASNAVVVGFNVRPIASVRNFAETEGVEIRLYNVIYKVADDIKLALQGMLKPTFAEKVIGQVEVRNIFKSTKAGTIAGCYVTDGSITRDALVTLIRDGVVIYDGELASLKRFKDDAREVKTGYECGLSIKGYNDIKIGDVLEASQLQEVK